MKNGWGGWLSGVWIISRKHRQRKAMNRFIFPSLAIWGSVQKYSLFIAIYSFVWSISREYFRRTDGIPTLSNCA
jgi:hypothetical protein